VTLYRYETACSITGRFIPLVFGWVGVVTVAVAFPNLTLPVVQVELRLIVTGSLSALLLGFLLRAVYGRCPLVTLPHDRPSIMAQRNVYRFLRMEPTLVGFQQ
jgi:hypothetical protein